MDLPQEKFVLLDKQRVLVQVFKDQNRLIYTNLGLDDQIFGSLGSKTEQIYALKLKESLLISNTCSCIQASSNKKNEYGLITVTSRIRKGLRYPHIEVNSEAGAKQPIVIQFYPSFKLFGDQAAAKTKLASDANIMLTTEDNERVHKVKSLQSLTMLSLAKNHAGLTLNA